MSFHPRKTFLAHAATALALALLSACGGGFNDDLPLAFSATLTGAEQVPSNASPVNGIGLVTVDPDRRTLTASIVATGLADIDAHIHEAQPRLIGPVVFPLAKAPGTVVWTTRMALTHAQLRALKDGAYYMDVHTSNLPNGEIRGQLVWSLPSPDQIARLEQVRNQSPLLDRQLWQVRDIEDAWDHDHWTGIGWGITIGF